jgi:hypothetical protein
MNANENYNLRHGRTRPQGMVVHDYKAWSYTTTRHSRTRLLGMAVHGWECSARVEMRCLLEMCGAVSTVLCYTLAQCTRLRVGGHVGGSFSVPPRTVWIPCCLSRLVGSLSGIWVQNWWDVGFCCLLDLVIPACWFSGHARPKHPYI